MSILSALYRGTTASDARSSIEHGMFLMAAGSLMAPGVHAIAKGLSATLSPGQIAWSRFALQCLVLLPIILLQRRGRLPPPSFSQALRGMLLAAATLFFFWALTYMPLADSSAIFFVEPLLLTLLSAVFLKERVGWRRLLAVLVGLFGALIIIRPRFEAIGAAALLPLLTAFCIAAYLAITRRLAPREDPYVMQLWVCLFSVIVLGLIMALGAEFGWKVVSPSWPQGGEWWLLTGLGAIALTAHMLAISAFRKAPASVLAPFQYLEICGATLLGVIFFGDLPDMLTGLGIGVIVASGLYVFYREQSLGRRQGVHPG